MMRNETQAITPVPPFTKKKKNEPRLISRRRLRRKAKGTRRFKQSLYEDPGAIPFILTNPGHFHQDGGSLHFSFFNFFFSPISPTFPKVPLPRG
jgi:hypothetical protein